MDYQYTLDKSKVVIILIKFRKMFEAVDGACSHHWQLETFFSKSLEVALEVC